MVRRYIDTDFEQVESWFKARNIPISKDYLSQTGFIEPGKAAGWIFSTDSNWCIFECFVGNPNCTHQERKEALREIVKEMIKESKELGFKEAFGFATSQTMLQIGMENEFKIIETCSSIVRKL